MKHLAVEHSVVMAFVKRDTEDISTLKEEENGDESEDTKAECNSSEEQKNNGDSEKDENSKSGSFVKWANDDDAATADETGETATESVQKATVADVRRILDSDSESGSEADQ